jgi:hypothetical protein
MDAVENATQRAGELGEIMERKLIANGTPR